LWRFDNNISVFSLSMRRNSYFGTPGQKSNPAIRSGDLDFLKKQMHFHYRVTFTGYIRCFCATTSHDPVTLTFDVLTSRVSHVQCFSCSTHIPIISFLRL